MERKTMRGDLVSVIVLTYNRRRLLRDCLDSLLHQTYPSRDIEIVVADDGSIDGTREAVTSYQSNNPSLRYIHQPHRGISAARNHGIREARGRIIAIVADDYILDPTYVERIVRFFDEYRDAQIVRFRVVPAQANLGSSISHCYYDTSVRRRLAPARKEPMPGGRWTRVLKRAFDKMPAVEEKITTDHQLEASGAAAFRREVFDRVGLFNESYARAEDSELTARLKTHGIPVYYCPQPRVRHQYGHIPIDTLCKCFLTGYSRFRYYQKHPPASARGHGVVKQLSIVKMIAIVDALRRARQAETIPGFLFYLPFMFLFEVANKVGFVCGWIGSRKRTPGAGTPARSPN